MSHVVFALAEGRTARLGHGDVIGRSPRAELVIDHPRVSGLHAQVELRAGGLSLLALRGAVHCAGDAVSERVIEVGQRYELGGAVGLEVVEVDHGTGAVALPSTDRVSAPVLELVVYFDTVGLAGAGLQEPVVLAGLKGLLVGELVRIGEPVHWHRVARRLWPLQGRDPAEHKELVRARWYQLTARLRKELADAGLDRELVVAGGGMVRLALLPTDRVVDRSD